MVLSSELAKKMTSDIKENSCKYMVLNIENFNYRDDTIRFGHSVEILNLINTIHCVNDLNEKIGAKNKIDTKILYRCIEANLMDKPFTEEELTTYFNAMIELERFYTAVQKITSIDIYIPYEAEFVLLGLTYEEYNELPERDKENLCEYYGNAYCDFRLENTSVNDFINKARKIIENCSNKKLL